MLNGRNKPFHHVLDQHLATERYSYESYLWLSAFMSALTLMSAIPGNSRLVLMSASVWVNPSKNFSAAPRRLSTLPTRTHECECLHSACSARPSRPNAISHDTLISASAWTSGSARLAASLPTSNNMAEIHTALCGEYCWCFRLRGWTV